MLNINWELAANIVNILVLFLLLKHFLFVPVKTFMDNREKSIVDSIANANQVNEDALQLKDKYELALKDARQEADHLVQKAKDRAQVEYDAILKDANQSAAKQLEQANKAIAVEKAKAMEQIQSEVAGLALAAAAKVAGQSMDQDANKRLVDAFLSEAGAGE